MNMYDAWSETGPGGYFGLFRRVDRADGEHVCKDGKPILFPSHREALCAARGVVIDIINGDIQAWGDRPDMSAQSVAERAFGAVFVKGRQVKVERK